MRFTQGIDLFIADSRASGRINSQATERSYRGTLLKLAEDVSNRDPRTVNREDIKRTLARWPNPNSQRTCRSILISFFSWLEEEGLRKDNPARQTRRPRKRPTTVYRLTRAEAAAMLGACRTTRERRAIFLGLLAGLRNAELRGLQGRHFRRHGFIWVSADIAKGGRERWIPVLPELVDVVAEIRLDVAEDEFVLPAQRWRDAPFNRQRMALDRRASSSQALRTLVMEVAARAGISAHVHPHVMRHYFGENVARLTGIRNAQAMLGHATVGTTELYTGKPSLDDLLSAVQLMAAGSPLPRTPQMADEATTGIEPVLPAGRAPEPNADYDDPLLAPFKAAAEAAVDFYVEALLNGR